MKLTGRQKAFLERFLDLYREAREPLHYTTVAERLGIGRVTAYDMLRTLEDKGLVRSEYVLPSERTGAGRSTIVFRPTDQGTQMLPRFAGSDWEQSKWEEVRQNILEALHNVKENDYEELLEDILHRLEEQTSPLVAAAEMVTAVVLSLRTLQQDIATGGLTERLKGVGFPGDFGLEALAGLTVGLSLVERLNRRLRSQLLRHVQSYQANLSHLSSHNRRRLADFAQDVWRLTSS